MADVPRLQAFLRAVAGAGRSVVPAPPFVVFIDERDSLRYLNYAVPEGDVDPTQAEVDRLRRAFRERSRLPRLEWIEELAPRLAPALGSCGMREELATPLMACAPDDLRPVPAVEGGPEVSRVGPSDRSDLVTVQREAFGLAALPPGEEAPDPRAHGGDAVLARIGGEAVAAASRTVVIDGVAEIGGVATARAWRRRGLAGLVTRAAAKAAFESGASLLVLSPGDASAQGVYARAGFRPAATILHWSDPD